MDEDVKTIQAETPQTKPVNSNITSDSSILLDSNPSSPIKNEAASTNGTEVINSIKNCVTPLDTNTQHTINPNDRDHAESSTLNGSVIGNGVADVNGMAVDEGLSSSGVAYYTGPAVCYQQVYYPESVREVSALLQQARCSSPPQSPPHATPVAPTLAAVAASTTHTCGSLYAQCGVNHHQHGKPAHTEPVSLSEILTQPSYYSYNEHFNAIDTLEEEDEEEDKEALLREYHKQQLRFLASMGNGVSSGSCTSSSTNNPGNLQADGQATTAQRASPIGASNVFRVSQHEDYEYLRGLVPQLKREAKEWEAKSDSLEAQVLELRRELKIREQEVIRLQREVHKLKVST